MSMEYPKPTRIRYEVARQWIADADLLLYRRRSLISIAGRGSHSHAAKAVCLITPPSLIAHRQTPAERLFDRTAPHFQGSMPDHTILPLGR